VLRALEPGKWGSAGLSTRAVDQGQHRRENGPSMNAERLTTALAERVMGWRVRGDRLLMENRQWKPRWRFQPATKIPDAWRLLQKAMPEEFAVRSDASGEFCAEIRINGRMGTATDKSQAKAITYAVARALNLDIDGADGKGDADGI
jgi:hypothetical protein